MVAFYNERIYNILICDCDLCEIKTSGTYAEVPFIMMDI